MDKINKTDEELKYCYKYPHLENPQRVDPVRQMPLTLAAI